MSTIKKIPENYSHLKNAIYEKLSPSYGLATISQDELHGFFAWVIENFNANSATRDFSYRTEYARNGLEDDIVSIEITASIENGELQMKNKFHGASYGIMDNDVCNTTRSHKFVLSELLR